MTEMLHHGNGGELGLHQGLCLTDDVDSARDYAQFNTFRGTPVVHSVELDLTGLTVAEVAGFDRDENLAVADHQRDGFDADILVYTDEDYSGRAHQTWRLMSEAALAAVTLAATIDAEEL